MSGRHPAPSFVSSSLSPSLNFVLFSSWLLFLFFFFYVFLTDGHIGQYLVRRKDSKDQRDDADSAVSGVN